MKNSRHIKSILLSSLLLSLSAWVGHSAEPPAPYGAVPTEQQVQWQRLEYYGFVHFGINTFTGKEWGYGDEDPGLFNPSDFQAGPIVKLFKDAGMKGMILTAKHHDGFCLWPTKTTRHNISQSPWKNGKGDLVKEFADACRREGILFGTYISPWDRNNAQYARDGYLKDYYAQITELLSGRYGDIFEIWFDGANGGDGYYGGAREKRNIPPGYYNFPKIVGMIRKLQPGCIIWGAGTHGDARWGGSERGHVGYPHWATLSSAAPKINEASGDPHGDRWVPAEGDTSIRRGWFWHSPYNNTVKTPEHLLQIWLECVGRGANLILNVPPDRSGHIYPADAKALMEFKELRDRMYSSDFARGATAAASNVRGNDPQFAPERMFDGDIESYWTTDDGQHTPTVDITLKEPATFDLVRVREQIRLGQRVERFKVEAWLDGAWQTIVDGKTIGNQVILPSARGRVTTDRLRLSVTSSPAVPCISEFSLLLRPSVVPQAVPSRRGDQVVVNVPEGCTVRYTLDGSDPDEQSPQYEAPLALPDGATVKTRVYNRHGDAGAVAAETFGISKAGWKLLESTSSGSNPEQAFDDQADTFWDTGRSKGNDRRAPQSFTIDMGAARVINGFSYLPRQDGSSQGMTDRYTFEVSPDNKRWATVAEGEFSNLKANPVEQFVPIRNLSTPVRYFRFTGTHSLDDGGLTAAEINVFTKTPE